MGEYGVFWFITVLWCSQNLFNLLYQSRMRNFWIPLLIAIGYISQLFPNVLPWDIQVMPIATVFIWAGYIIKIELYPKLQSANMKVLISISILTLLLIFFLRDLLTIDMKNNIFRFFPFSIITSAIASVAFAIIAMALSKTASLCKLFATIGLASMVIMYLHQPIKYIVLSRLGIIEYNAVVVTTSILLSLAAYKLLSKYPCTKQLV